MAFLFCLLKENEISRRGIRERKLTLHDAGHQQRCLAGAATQTSVKKVPLELLVNLIPRDLFLQSQRIGRIEFHAKAKQNLVHIWNIVAVTGRICFCRPVPSYMRACVLCAKEAQHLQHGVRQTAQRLSRNVSCTISILILYIICNFT